MTLNKDSANDVKTCSSTSDVDVFKKPTTPVTKAPKRKKILDEETYTHDLETIIERDFYPDLSQMKAQLEYREALENNDVVRLRELRLKYGTKLDTSRPGTGESGAYKSPATFETPLSMNEGTPSTHGDNRFDAERFVSQKTEGNKRVDGRNLDAYLGKHTSEDNASFSSMMEDAAERHRLKYAWLYDKERENAKFQNDALALPSPEEQATDRHRVPSLDTWTYTNRNFLMYVPDGAPLTEEEAQQLALKQREVVHSNSRFHKIPFNEVANRQAISAAAQIQARAKEGKIGVDGKELVPSEEPMVNGYGFVVTPSPAPGVDESPLMTWGEIDGTPFRLDGSDTPSVHSTPGPSFRIAAMPARDKLALQLAEKVGKQHREKKQLALKAVRATLASPSPRSSHMERLASMSPAAQRLASSKLGIHIGTDKSLRLSYTPSPSHAKTSEGRTPTVASANTPPFKMSSSHPVPTKCLGTQRALNMNHSMESLTDDLLHLPKRSKAADFFSVS